MIIILFIILAVPVGYLLGGKLGNVRYYTTRALGLPVAALLLEAAAPFLRTLISAPVSQWQWMFVTAEYLLLFLFCFLNIKSKAVWMILAACVLNFFVIAINGFQMPIAPFAREMPDMAATLARVESGEYFRYTIARAGDPFWFLGDVILIPVRRIGGFASVGDLLLGIGSAALFIGWMRLKKPDVKTNGSDPAA